MDLFGVGLPELIVIFVVALLVFGPRKLPEISKTIARGLKSFQDASRDFQTALYQEAEELERTTRLQSSKPKTQKAQKAKSPAAISPANHPDTSDAETSADLNPSEVGAPSDSTAAATVPAAQSEGVSSSLGSSETQATQTTPAQGSAPPDGDTADDLSTTEKTSESQEARATSIESTEAASPVSAA